MAEFKKLSDVNILENLTESTKFLVEDEGEIAKIAPNGFKEKLLKTDDNFALNEDGTVTSNITRTFWFIDGTEFGVGLNNYNTFTANELIESVRHTFIDTKIERMVMKKNNPQNPISRFNTGHTLINNGDETYSCIFYFGDDLAPIIVNGADGSFIVDPDWVAPAEIALKSDVDALFEEKMITEEAATEIINGAGRAVKYFYDFDMSTLTMKAKGIQLATPGSSICGVLPMETNEQINAGDLVTIQHMGISRVLLKEDCEKGYELEVDEDGSFVVSTTKVDAYALESGSAGEYVRARIVSGEDIGMNTVLISIEQNGPVCSMPYTRVSSLYGSITKIRAILSYTKIVDDCDQTVIKEAIKIVRIWPRNGGDKYFQFTFLADDGSFVVYQLNPDDTITEVTA